MQGFGSFEPDERGQLCYLPAVPSFPKLDDVWCQLQRATRAVEEFDRALAAFPVPDVVGKLFARLDAGVGSMDPLTRGDQIGPLAQCRSPAGTMDHHQADLHRP